MIKKALSVLPTRPVLYIVPPLVVLLMAFYYWNLYTDCTHDTQFRSELSELLSAQDAVALHLANITNFNWDKLRIIENYQPENNIDHCPFSWGWSADERKDLIASSLLSVLIFGYDGIIVEHLEVRSDHIDFKNVDTSLSPDTAIFTIDQHPSNTNAFTLSLLPQ